MVNLETNYLGLKLRNPIIVSSSGLTNSVEKIGKLVEAGAGAVVLKSLFEEQINYDYSLGKVIGGFSIKRISTMPYLNSRTPFDSGDSFRFQPIKAIITDLGELVEFPEITEQDYWSYGFFLQATHRLSTKLSIFAGARYDWETFNHQSSFNPRVGMIFKPRPGESLKLMFGQAFISPSAYFKFKAWADKDYAHLPSFLFGKELEPEKITSVEFNYSRHTKNLYLSASIYFSRSVDTIQEAGELLKAKAIMADDSIKDYTIEIPVNAGTQKNFGIDLYSTYKLNENFSVNLGYSFLNARTSLHGHSYDSPKVSHHKVYAGFTGYWGRHLVFNLKGRWRSAIHTAPTNTVYKGGTIPGIFLLDMNLEWRNLLKGLSLKFTAKNLLNSKYFTAANESGDPTNGASLPRVPQEPFRFFLGLDYAY